MQPLFQGRRFSPIGLGEPWRLDKRLVSALLATHSRNSVRIRPVVIRLGRRNGNLRAHLSRREPPHAGDERVEVNVGKLILQELSFSGSPMKKDQIAKAIDYPSSQTERALKCLESSGKLVQKRGWAMGSHRSNLSSTEWTRREPPNEILIGEAAPRQAASALLCQTGDPILPHVRAKSSVPVCHGIRLPPESGGCTSD